jgi:organic hydroperoxide reductase OsmC/OhrA
MWTGRHVIVVCSFWLVDRCPVFGGDKRPSASDIDAIHHRAHDACFIANSVKSEVRVEGV